MKSSNKDIMTESAYMVHHVLRKGQKNIKTKRLERNPKPFTKENQTNLPNVKQNKPSKRRNKKRNKKNIINFAEKANITNVPKNPSPVKKTPVKSKTSDAESPKIKNVSKSSEALLFEECFVKKTLFQWIIDPITVDDFMKHYWEKKPLHVSKRHSQFSLLLSSSVIDKLLHYSNITYTKNIDVTFYSEGKKELHNLEGIARPHVIWDFYCNKCSIRLLNPQTFVPYIHKMNSELQEFFGCFVGCNAYLTPPHSQGFAPHYDDIEAFILQIEGKKSWKIYEPRSEHETLPRFSSTDFTDEMIGKPIMEICLEEGDVLYLPRGYIHQASTQDSNHSLHITISAYQRNAWIDLLEKAIPKALENAWKNDIEFRKGLPFDYLKAAGFARNVNYKETKTLLKNNLKELIHKLVDHVQLDSAVDELGVKLMHDALPPVLTEEEKKCSVFEGGLRMSKNGQIKGFDKFTFTSEMELVLLRQHVARFVKEIDKTIDGKERIVYRLYFTTDNSLEYHAEEPSFYIIRKQSVKLIQTLFQCYPNYISIADLPHDNPDEKVNLVADLWERGIVRTKEPILS